MSNRTRLPFYTPAVVFFLVLLGILGLGATPAQAQQEEDTGPPEALHPGAWALQFAVGENFTLESFSGSTLSLKWHLSAPSALQSGITVETSSSDREMDTEEGTQQDSNDSRRLTLSLSYVNYPLLGHRETSIEPFFAVGPQFSYVDSSSERTLNDSLEVRQSSKGWALGLGAMLGAEWFVHRQIGLHAAYRVGGVFQRETFKRQLGGEEEEEGPKDERFAIQANGVRFGVSVYF